MNFIVIDTETTNTLEEPIAYDIGWAVIDENGETNTVISTRWLCNHSFKEFVL